ncbi:IS66 family transposase [Flavobacterium sp. F-65]|uniref:IS66 family transposase n=1 Tax=Flavobacterium pisciphilum TaxID=2893755 RepID=A0ABS8MYZ3_9FLAO|nr:IS66 family transposase [Flavobacterium sp. F-65]MCC9073996.1 IS66 family transposase [Flavobacterium sp. F-65]
MQATFEKLSKQELLTLVKVQNDRVLELENKNGQIANNNHTLSQQYHTLSDKCDYLQYKVALLTRMLFGQQTERFAKAEQPELPFAPSAEEQKQVQEQIEEKITYTRKKAAGGHKGRAALPEHLPVEEIEIHPEQDLTDSVVIGKDITDELEFEPARFYIKRYIRYKYATKDRSSVSIGPLPERVIDKGIPGPGLLASILTDKYMDHLPLYRQKQRFAREDIKIASSTLEGWTKEALRLLEPLYDKLVADTKSQGYLQVDETTIKVLESEKKGACHRGYYWVYHAPLDGTVLFDYSPTRGAEAPYPILKDFKGYLQSDGYAVYESFGKAKEVTHLACWAHARREYERALDNDKTRAETALVMIQKLYAVERQCRTENLNKAQVKELRLATSLPVLNELGKWIAEDIRNVPPKSQIGKAMAYSIRRWKELCAYLYDGDLEIDNNRVENAIRPVALGRKNYLFAGSHEAAQRAAMIYSFFAICKKHEVNPFKWLKYTLENIKTIKYKDITNLYPQNYKKLQKL